VVKRLEGKYFVAGFGLKLEIKKQKFGKNNSVSVFGNPM